MSPTRRLVSLVVLAVMAISIGVADAVVDRPRADVEADEAVPAGANAEAESSAWYCVGATTDDPGIALGTIVMANATTRDLTATITAIATEAASVTTTVTVPALGRATQPLRDLMVASHVSAIVELDGGSAAVELATEGPLGNTTAPCATTASAQWYLADGTTSRDALEVLYAFNPFPDDALVDMSFVTETGTVTPEGLTGITVRGRSLTALDIGQFVPRQEHVSAVVSTRSGRLVVARRQSFDGSVDRRGVALSLGATSPGTQWYFPEGLTLDGLVERYQIFNPGDVEARVEIEVLLDEGQAEPILVSVAPETQLSVVANDESRIPAGVGHAVAVRSLDDVGIVVERKVQGGDPSPRTGLALTSGARSVSERWLVASARVDPDHDQLVVIQNPGDAATSVEVVALVGREAVVSGLEAVEVPARGRVSIRLGDHGLSGANSLILTAGTGVIVEQVQLGIDQPQMALAMAVPLR